MPCLLHLVPLTVATIHLYLAADAPNHSILPLIHLNSTPLEESTPPTPNPAPPSPRSTQACILLIRPSTRISIRPSIHGCACPSVYPPIHTPVTLSSVHLDLDPQVRLCDRSAIRLSTMWNSGVISHLDRFRYVPKKADLFRIDQHISFWVILCLYCLQPNKFPQTPSAPQSDSWATDGTRPWPLLAFLERRTEEQDHGRATSSNRKCLFCDNSLPYSEILMQTTV